MTLINLIMHLTVRLTQFWITSTANTNALQAYHVMTSPTSDATPHQAINLVHIHLFYHVAQEKQAQHGSHVDRGANGGLAGSDVRVLSKSS